MTRILLVGSGAREHAIAASIAKCPDAQLFAAMSSNNPGIIKLPGKASVVEITDNKAVADFALRNRIEIAVIGPEAPLVNGLVDALDEVAIPSVGPTRKLAALEGDKAFCRELLEKYGIRGNPSYRVFTDIESAESFLETSGPVAIKPAGLTGGKGVKVSGEDLPTRQDEIAYARQILRNKIGGVQKLVVEEKLEGEEYSLQAFVDGHDIQVMPPVQDHKRAYENDSGPNTGGMGSYSDHDHLLPFVSQTDLDYSSAIMRDVVRALRKELDEDYQGILYGQFMLAKSIDEGKPSPKLIEFNCRFGDPEAMNVLSVLTEESDLADICLRITEGRLKRKHVAFENKATVCKYLVPATYPERPFPRQTILIDEKGVASKGAKIFYASVDLVGDNIVTTASRAIALVGTGDTIDGAERIVEAATAHVSGPLRHRRDIGTAALLQKRIDHMKRLGASVPIAEEPQAGIV